MNTRGTQTAPDVANVYPTPPEGWQDDVLIVESFDTAARRRASVGAANPDKPSALQILQGKGAATETPEGRP